jgi:hypothetical protein
MKAIEIGKPEATTGCLAKGEDVIDVERRCRLKPNKFVTRDSKE